ncbi:DUF6456 domain-containing protein [Sulfitobacter sediminilitoris]|nr:DUF6456 domain-containing protein [Sulfitobacter sediminilitoris]
MTTTRDMMGFEGPGGMPGWVPAGALHYIAHTEKGQPIRALARQAGCHASTILRQIRKVEMRRDDPLVDAALRKLGAASTPSKPQKTEPKQEITKPMTSKPQITMPDEETLAREAARVLRRLCETGAVLAVAAELDKAVVVRDMPGGTSARTAVVDAPIAQAMALKDWITPANTGRIIRYHITSSGRSALTGFLDRFGVPQDAASKAVQPGEADAADRLLGDGATNARARYALGESPLSALARRRDRDGTPFLAEQLVHAGERLREDFELAQMDGSVTQNWDHFLTAGIQSGSTNGGTCTGAPAAARGRVQAALQNLGPGLSDVVLRCCCYLEGLETAEKRLGWSARSGKIVLRIALIRLKRHYDETVGPGGPLIG